MAKLVVALALLVGMTAGLVGSTAISFAQSQPNNGANSPGGGDTYGEPYSGSVGAKQKAHGW